MTRSTFAMILALVAATGATAALANDVIELRLLDRQKQEEAASTSNVVLGNDLKSMPVAVISAKGPIRDVAVVIMDMRSAYRAPFASIIMPPEIYADAERKKLISRHPVVRISGTVDCRTGDSLWNSLDLADTTTSAPASVRTFGNPSHNGNLPERIDDAARVSICAIRPATA